MQLSPNFWLREFTRSATASKYDILNKPSREQIERMQWLCAFLLEPIRSKWGGLRISSGFRCPQLNHHPEVGGSENSFHQYADKRAAADVQPIRKGVKIADVFNWIRLESGLLFDRIILERGKLPRHEYDDTIHIQISTRPRRVALLGPTHGQGTYTAVEVG